MDCPVCCLAASDAARAARARRACPHCHFACCTTCVQTYMLSTHDDPHCMACRRPFSLDHLHDMTHASFLLGAYREHRERTLLQREQSHMPLTRPLADYVRVLHQLERARRAVPGGGGATTPQQALQLVADVARLRSDAAAVMIAAGLREDTAAPALRCPDRLCPGAVSGDWRCSHCRRGVCTACRSLIGDAHVCSADAATVRSILELTKPCPRCAAPISKDGGCSQMFCTACHTGFDWDTMLVVRENLHNPHYFEWLHSRTATPLCEALTSQIARNVGHPLAGGRMTRRLRRAMLATDWEFPDREQFRTLQDACDRALRARGASVQLNPLRMFEHLQAHARALTSVGRARGAQQLALQNATAAAATFARHGLPPMTLAALREFWAAHGRDERLAANEDLRLLRLLDKIDDRELQRSLCARERRRALALEVAQWTTLYRDALAESLHRVDRAALDASEMVGIPLIDGAMYARNLVQRWLDAPRAVELRRVVCEQIHAIALIKGLINESAERLSRRTRCATVFIHEHDGLLQSHNYVRKRAAESLV